MSIVAIIMYHKEILISKRWEMGGGETSKQLICTLPPDIKLETYSCLLVLEMLLIHMLQIHSYLNIVFEIQTCVCVVCMCIYTHIISFT